MFIVSQIVKQVSVLNFDIFIIAVFTKMFYNERDRANSKFGNLPSLVGKVFYAARGREP